MYGRLDDVRADAVAAIDTVSEAHRHIRFSQGVFARCGGADIKLLQPARDTDNFFNGHTGRVHGTIAGGSFRCDFIAVAQFDQGYGRVHAGSAQLFQLIGLKSFVIHAHDQHAQVIGVHLFFLVSQINKEFIQLINFRFAQFEAQFLAAAGQPRPAGMFSQHQVAALAAHRFRGHDFIGQGMGYHAVLVNAGFVGESVAPHHGLVEGDGQAGDHAEQRAGGHNLRGFYAAFVGIAIAARMHGHHHLFQGGVARAFADAVYGTFDLPRAALNGRQRIGHRQAQVIVVMGGENDLVRAFGLRNHIAEHFPDFIRGRVADRVR